MSDIKINRITNANVYFDGVGLLGQVEECSLPQVKNIKTEHKVLGLQFKPKFTSGVDSMETKFKWNSFYPDVLMKVANPYKTIKVQVRGHLQTWDSSGNSSNQKIVAFMTIVPSDFPQFSFKPQDNIEAENTCDVFYYKLQIGDKEVLEIDVLANIHKVNGVDLLADYRANIGG